MTGFFNLKQKIFLFVIGVLLLLNIFAWQYVFALNGLHYLKVDVLDVGQGDSIFIETPNMRHMLIDGGPDASVLGKLAKVLPFWDKTLDVVILTHPDQDHLMGLLYVLQQYKVNYILWTGMVRDSGNYKKWVELLKEKQKQGTKIIIAKANLEIISGGATLEILHPFEDLTGKFFGKADNDTGVVSRLVYRKNSFLFPADVSSQVEQKMVDAKVNLVSDMLKVSHHGSKYSSSENFLQAVHPVIAVISVGKGNPYGHPTSEVLQKLSKFGIKTFRTDQDGTVEAVSDGNHVIIKKEKK